MTGVYCDFETDPNHIVDIWWYIPLNLHGIPMGYSQLLAVNPFKSSNFGPKAQVLDGASIHIAAEGEAISPGAAGDAQGAEPIFFFDDLVAM